MTNKLYCPWCTYGMSLKSANKVDKKVKWGKYWGKGICERVIKVETFFTCHNCQGQFKKVSFDYERIIPDSYVSKIKED